MKINVMLLACFLVIPGFLTSAVALDENWGVAVDDVYYYTFGMETTIDLPTDVWEMLTDELQGNLDDMFNNSYKVGYANVYDEGYDFGYNNHNDSNTAFNDTANPYPMADEGFADGQYYGFRNGYRDGWYDYDYDNGYKPEFGYYGNNYEKYVGVAEFPGFPQTEIDAIDLKDIYDEFQLLPKIFNMKVEIEHMNEYTDIDEYDNQEFYYDVINVTVTMKLATDGDYDTFEDCIVDYLDTEVRGFLTAAFDTPEGYIVGNMTEGIDGFNEGVDWITQEINKIGYVNILENRGVAWGTGSNVTELADDFVENMVFDVLQNFGLNTEVEYDQYDLGYAQGYEEGYFDGYYGFAYSNPYSTFTSFEHGAYDGYLEGHDDGGMDDFYSYDFKDEDGYYDNWAQDDDNFDLYVAEPPSDYGYFPMFIPTDLDVGEEMEVMKDVYNIQMARTPDYSKYAGPHLLNILGGFNAFTDQLGVDFVTNEKQLYIAGEMEDSKWMAGKIFDLGGIMFINQLNEEIEGMPELDFILDNESMDFGGVWNMEWDAAGVLQNYHVEYHAGMKYDVTNSLGIHTTFDLSEGEHTTLNAHFDGTVPDQKNYPKELQGNWFVDEGDQYEFEVDYDYDVQMPQSFWDNLSDVVTEELNETLFDETGDYLTEEADAEAIFNAFRAELPSTIEIQSTISDIVAIDEEWEDNGTIYSHQYDFLIQYMLARSPGDPFYRPVGTLIMDIWDGIYDALDALPDPFDEFARDQMDISLEELLNETSAGDYAPDVSLIEVVMYFVPHTLHMWGIDSNTPEDWPDFAIGLGAVDYLYVELLERGIAQPSVLYVPTDFDMVDVYDDFWVFMEDEENVTEADFDEFRTNMSISLFDVQSKEMHMQWDVDGIDDIFFHSMDDMDADLTNNTNEFIEMLYNETGEEFTNDSIEMFMKMDLEYTPDGILNLSRFEMRMGMETVGGEELSFSQTTTITYMPPPAPVEDDDTTDDDTTDDDTTDDDTTDDDDDSSPFGNIPGFSTGLLVVSLLGVTAFIIFSKRK